MNEARAGLIAQLGNVLDDKDLEDFDRIAARVHDKLREMADTLELARTGRYNAARDLARLDHGRQAMDEIRDRLEALAERRPA